MVLDFKRPKIQKLLLLASTLIVSATTVVLLYQCVFSSMPRSHRGGSSVSLGLREGNIPPVYSFPPVAESLRLRVEMSSLCQAMKDIPELVWIALQDAQNKTQVLKELLKHCDIHSLRIKSKALPLEMPEVKQSTIFAITPTYKRMSQKVDLTSLCQTLMNVPDLIWIVVEDAEEKTHLVAALLERCNVTSVNLRAASLPGNWPSGRGIEQRNYGLEWIRSYCNILSRVRPCQGVVYFMDDDNKYDLRLFEEIRKTKEISVFPIAFAGGLKVEGPVCKEGKVVEWRAAVMPVRKFPIDMAAFAVNVQMVLDKPNVWMGYRPDGTKVGKGKLETNFLENFAEDKMKLECRGDASEVLAWHVRVQKPKLYREIASMDSRVDIQY